MITGVGLGVGGAVLSWLGAAFWLDRHGLAANPTGTYRWIAVAGCAVLPDGRPSPALERRARLAARLYGEGLAPQIITTGGVGTHGPAEALVAAEVLERHGVPRAAIVLEVQSTTTLQNARFAADLVGSGRVLVVSDCYHVWRCRRLFAAHFGEADAVGAVPPSRRLRARMAVREVGSVLKGWWHGHAGLGGRP